MTSMFYREPGTRRSSRVAEWKWKPPEEALSLAKEQVALMSSEELETLRLKTESDLKGMGFKDSADADKLLVLILAIEERLGPKSTT